MCSERHDALSLGSVTTLNQEKKIVAWAGSTAFNPSNRGVEEAEFLSLRPVWSTLANSRLALSVIYSA